MLYPFTANIICPETKITLIPDFECSVEISASVVAGFLDTNCSDVIVDGVSLADKSPFAQALTAIVLEQAAADLERAGSLWDAVAKAEGIHWHQGPESDGYFYQERDPDRARDDRQARQMEAAE